MYVIYLPWARQWCRWWWWRWRPLRQSTQPLLTDFFSFITYSPVGHIQSSYRKETAHSRQFFFWFLIAAKIWYYSSLSFCIADEREKGTEGIAHRLGWLMLVIPTIRGQLHVDVMDAIINTAMFFFPLFLSDYYSFAHNFVFFKSLAPHHLILPYEYSPAWCKYMSRALSPNRNRMLNNLPTSPQGNGF